MLEQGQRYNSPMLATNVLHQVIQAASQMGLAGQDSVAFIEVLRAMAGLPRRA